jgi:hypothetical protein
VPRFAVIAYGKLGGKELGYVSDLDVIFLFDDDDQDAPTNYAKLAQRFITWMTTHTAAGILFDIDTALRPDGASGMLVSSIGGLRALPAAFGLDLGTPGADARPLLRRRRRHRRALRGDPRTGAAPGPLAAPPSCAGSGEHAQAHARRAPERQRPVRPEAGPGRHDRHRVHRAVPGAASRGQPTRN